MRRCSVCARTDESGAEHLDIDSDWGWVAGPGGDLCTACVELAQLIADHMRRRRPELADYQAGALGKSGWRGLFSLALLAREADR